jgi:tetratricopeptide (TPR) repeat protein
LFFDWDWKGAEQALRRAIALNPNDSHAWHHLANYMRATGRFADAIAARHRAVALDPLNARTAVLLGADYRASGDLERALVYYRRALKLEPAHTFALGSGPFLPIGEAEILADQGRFAEAAEAYARIASLRGAKQGEVDDLRAAYAASGMPGFWRRWIEMDVRQSEGAPDALRMAKLWTLAGDTSTALTWLERAFAARHPALIYLKYDTILAPLRTNPRVVHMLTTMGFPGP